ncbi:hypothetical protein [Burkholderia gladioli]|uniref:hypothetical protein n=1 Tax=Burkholderia gladioli TaxID=28095 RepID=UPI001FC801B1|nr:hypothetical protein [Burkholderia gladioli]
MAADAASIAKGPPLEHRIPGALIVSNNPRLDDRDRLFDEDKLQAAIRRFHSLTTTRLIKFEPDAMKHNPSNWIEPDTMNERGTRYRLNPDIGNGAIAVLAMVEAINVSLGAAEMMDASDEIEAMYDQLDDDWATI